MNAVRFVGWGAVALVCAYAAGYGATYAIDKYLTYDQAIDYIVYGLVALGSFGFFWPRMIGHRDRMKAN